MGPILRYDERQARDPLTATSRLDIQRSFRWARRKLDRSSAISERAEEFKVPVAD
jgi:hypothetical protein